MKKNIWDLYAPIYEQAMKSDCKAYKKMYDRIEGVVFDKEVLEVATGPGLLAKHVAKNTKHMIASDYSKGMIKQAQKKTYPDNLTFEVADALDLPYEDNKFDVIIIANALHIMPTPETALSEIKRVLKDKGILICPNFVNHNISKVWSKMLSIAGVRFEHQWTQAEYVGFLKKNGWNVMYTEYLSARIPLMYVECRAL